MASQATKLPPPLVREGAGAGALRHWDRTPQIYAKYVSKKSIFLAVALSFPRPLYSRRDIFFVTFSYFFFHMKNLFKFFYLKI